MTLLRNPDFQKLLLDYPRAKRTFLTTIEDNDVVTSQKLERYGKFDNAEDYLDARTADLAAEAITELEAVVDDLREIVALVGKGRRVDHGLRG